MTWDLGSFLANEAARIAHWPGGAWVAGAAFTIAGVAFVPLAVLATVTFAVFGAWPGIAIAWVGGLLSAMTSHAIGARLGGRAVARLFARAGRDPGPFLRRHGFWSAVVIRLLPGNFGASNLLAGATRIPARDFLLGNMLGLAIELVVLGVVLDRARAALREPSLGHVLGALCVVGVAVGLSVAFHRWWRRRADGQP